MCFGGETPKTHPPYPGKLSNYSKSHIASANDLSYDYLVTKPPVRFAIASRGRSTVTILRMSTAYLLLHANKCLYKQAKAAISLQQ
jgi:hypothetical protein